MVDLLDFPEVLTTFLLPPCCGNPPFSGVGHHIIADAVFFQRTSNMRSKGRIFILRHIPRFRHRRRGIFAILFSNRYYSYVGIGKAACLIPPLCRRKTCAFRRGIIHVAQINRFLGLVHEFIGNRDERHLRLFQANRFGRFG